MSLQTNILTVVSLCLLSQRPAAFVVSRGEAPQPQVVQTPVTGNQISLMKDVAAVAQSQGLSYQTAGTAVVWLRASPSHTV